VSAATGCSSSTPRRTPTSRPRPCTPSARRPTASCSARPGPSTARSPPPRSGPSCSSTTPSTASPPSAPTTLPGCAAPSSLRALGHHRIAYVGGPSSSWSDQARRAGLAAAAARHDDVEVVELGAFRPQVEGGQAAADLVVATGATAVITFNDLVAVGLVDRLRARRLRVPDDFSVVGCDDSYVASLVDPPLTTLRVDLRALGRAAVDQLVASAPGSPAPHLPPLDVDLVVRSSTAPPTAPPVDRGEP
jgi:hypothetical protein